MLNAETLVARKLQKIKKQERDGKFGIDVSDDSRYVV